MNEPESFLSGLGGEEPQRAARRGPMYVAGPTTSDVDFNRALGEVFDREDIGPWMRRIMRDTTNQRNIHMYPGRSPWNVHGLWTRPLEPTRESAAEAAQSLRQRGMQQAFPDVDDLNPEGHIFTYENAMTHEMWHRLQRETGLLQEPEMQQLKRNLWERWGIASQDQPFWRQGSSEAVPYLLSTDAFDDLAGMTPQRRERQYGWPETFPTTERSERRRALQHERANTRRPGLRTNAPEGIRNEEELDGARREFLRMFEEEAPEAYRRYTSRTGRQIAAGRGQATTE